MERQVGNFFKKKEKKNEMERQVANFFRKKEENNLYGSNENKQRKIEENNLYGSNENRQKNIEKQRNEEQRRKNEEQRRKNEEKRRRNEEQRKRNEEQRKRNEEKRKILNKINLFLDYLLPKNKINLNESFHRKLNELNIFFGNNMNLTITLILYGLIIRKIEFSVQKIIDISNILFNIMVQNSPNFIVKNTFISEQNYYDLHDFNLIPTNEGVCYQDRLLEYLLINKPSLYRSTNLNIIAIPINKKYAGVSSNYLTGQQNFKMIFNLPVVRKIAIRTNSPAIDVGGISQIFYEQIQDELNKIKFLNGNLNYIKRSYNEYPLKIKLKNDKNFIIVENLRDLENLLNRNGNENILPNIRKKNLYQILHIINTIFLCSMSVFNSRDVYDMSGNVIDTKIFNIKLSENSDFYKFIMYQYFQSIINEISQINLTSLSRKECESLFLFFLMNYDNNEEMSKLLDDHQKKYILEGNKNLNIPSYLEFVSEGMNIPLFSEKTLKTILNFYGYDSIKTFVKLHMIQTNISVENKEQIKDKINIISTSLTPQKKNKIKAAFDRFIDLLNQKELDIFCSYITGTKKLSNYNIKIFDIDPNVVQTNSSGRPVFTRPFASHTCFNTLDLNINISTAANNNALEELVFNYLTRPKSENNGNSEIRYQLIYAFSKSENLGIA